MCNVEASMCFSHERQEEVKGSTDAGYVSTISTRQRCAIDAFALQMKWLPRYCTAQLPALWKWKNSSLIAGPSCLVEEAASSLHMVNVRGLTGRWDSYNGEERSWPHLSSSHLRKNEGIIASLMTASATSSPLVFRFMLDDDQYVRFPSKKMLAELNDRL